MISKFPWARPNIAPLLARSGARGLVLVFATMQHCPYTLPVALTGAVAAGTAFYIRLWRGRALGAWEFFVVACAMACMNLAYAAELASASLGTQLFWLSVRYVGICVAPLAGLALALRWSGSAAWLTRGRLLALAFVPALTLVLAWTNEWHHLVQSPSTQYVRDGYVLRRAEARVVFDVFLLHTYGCLGGALVLYGRAALRSTGLRRRQGAALFVATLLPTLANLVYNMGSGADSAFDVSSFGYASACLVWAWALARDRLFDLVPLARDMVLDSMRDPVLVLVLDESGRAVDANRAASALFGGGEPLLGAPLASFVGSEEATRLLSGARGDLAFGDRLFDVRSSNVAAAGGARGSVLSFRDVTEKRRAQAERDRALRVAESASRARGDFLARMSHEVRTPLHAVLGAAELLRETGPTDASVRYVDAVLSSSRSLLALVDELLDFSRIDADEIELELESTSAPEAVRDVAGAFRGAAERAGLELRAFSPSSSAPSVSADPKRLRQILANLVGNALKFTPAGHVELRVVERGADVVRFEVEDSGVGIPDSARERIFEAFTQLNPPNARGATATATGTGLGLAIVRRLATRMGGSVGVESELGKGSTFWLELPRAHAPPATAPVRDPESGARRRERVVRGRVLLVDDHPVSRLVTAGLLEREGCDVDDVASAREALRRLASGAYVLVVTDVRMADMDGHELARAARELPNAPPVVAITADVVDQAREHALASGMRDWLPKPIDRALLARMLDRWAPSRVDAAEAATRRGAEARTTRAEALRLFFELAPREIEGIAAALREGRRADAARLAHALAGAAAMVGAVELARRCGALNGIPAEDVHRRLLGAYRAFEQAACAGSPAFAVDEARA